ncbi:uncharacterized protein LAESUDRAFT_754265 [Laetiporus sulphureus 93-53]|uniref:SH3 domain-containing protein n=1 Tax=Laetiporus sulphureus 93-53 TaxID=1314785 RepID=A0A165IMB5_9APHY|nr:uncharacterized protein LAESUDRAFT_754265 [Laetiporus sulphureus 93-53]KZT13277.1 hypothetical protein LAESUDRAFT_754265 [Laetiporus sulphureus 93-53]
MSRTSLHKKRDEAEGHSTPATLPDDDATPTAVSMKTTFSRQGASPPASPAPSGPSTPKITIPEPEPSLSASALADSQSKSLTSSRPAPPSPALSRRTSAALSRRSSAARSRRQSKISQAQHENEPSSSSTTTATPAQSKRRSLGVKIRDFAFPAGDPRRVGRGPDVPKPNRARHNSSASDSSSAGSSEGDAPDDVRPGWGSFRWNTLSSHFLWSDGGEASSADAGPSCTDFERNFDASSPTEEGDDPCAHSTPQDFGSEDDGTYPSEDGPLVPGLYRALFAFEPEGTAEMALEEEQVVRVVARGGGVGWAVVVREEGGHALVPESYLELVQVDPVAAGA